MYTDQYEHCFFGIYFSRVYTKETTNSTNSRFSLVSIALRMTYFRSVCVLYNILYYIVCHRVCTVLYTFSDPICVVQGSEIQWLSAAWTILLLKSVIVRTRDKTFAIIIEASNFNNIHAVIIVLGIILQWSHADLYVYVIPPVVVKS